MFLLAETEAVESSVSGKGGWMKYQQWTSWTGASVQLDGTSLPRHISIILIENKTVKKEKKSFSGTELKQKAKDTNFTHFYNSQLALYSCQNYTKCMILFLKNYTSIHVYMKSSIIKTYTKSIKWLSYCIFSLKYLP